MSFDDLVGQTVGFCGVDNNAFCVVTTSGERLAFEAIEDENDGYRSSLDELKPVPLDGLIFFSTPIVNLTIQTVNNETEEDQYGLFYGYRFIDENKHRWLLVGTSNNDDYYPSFTVAYDPPKTVCIKHDDCREHAELSQTCAATKEQMLMTSAVLVMRRGKEERR